MSDDPRKKVVKRLKRKQQVNRTIFLIAVSLVIVVAAVLLGRSGKKTAVKEAEIRTVAVDGAQVTAAAREGLVKAALEKDKFSKQLTKLLEKYPETEDILLSRADYPDWLIEYWIDHQEAVEWVLDYPEYAKVSDFELNEKAYQEIPEGSYPEQDGIPIYYQWDKTWGYASYGDGTIAVGGCGPTCVSMVLTGLQGDRTMTPKRVSYFSEKSGYYSAESGTDWNLMTEGAAQLGLKVAEVKWKDKEITKQLKAGHPMICSMAPGDFTKEGHFIILTGVEQDGKIRIIDPNSKINTEKTWDVENLLSQMKSMWAYRVK